MKIHKSALASAQVVRVDKDMPLLNNVHFTEDGDTVASNRRALIMCEGVDKDPDMEAVTVNAVTIQEVLKALPAERKRFGNLLDVVEMREEDGITFFEFSDGVRERKIEAKTYTHGYVKYKEILERVYARKGKGLVVNRARLGVVLKALEKIAPDTSGEFPLFIEFTDEEMILRCVHPVTGKMIVCVMWLSTAEEWLEDSRWEKKVSGQSEGEGKAKSGKTKVKVKVKRKVSK